MGTYIYSILNRAGFKSRKSVNPLNNLYLGSRRLLSIAPTVDLQDYDSAGVYATIRDRMVDWVESAIKIRRSYLQRISWLSTC